MNTLLHKPLSNSYLSRYNTDSVSIQAQLRLSSLSMSTHGYNLVNIDAKSKGTILNSYVVIYIRWLRQSYQGMLTFSLFWKTIVSLWKQRRKIENETIVFTNDRFLSSFFINGRYKTIVFQNDRFVFDFSSSFP